MAWFRPSSCHSVRNRTDPMASRTYIISYDIVDGEGDDYTELIDRIKAYGPWAHITLSTWAISTEKSASDIRDELEKLLPEGSRLFVVRSGGAGAWRNVFCKNAWLKKWL